MTMTSAEIRQSFMDFFAAREHAIVPSAPLMPTAPNLLFTNAGMNPFVPSFLGEREAPHPRVADTQKCIRAGGKHNDLDDVGWDTYHQTFFEMLGNWSFGDYFKKEAIAWAWELLTDVWKLPKERLYVTVYKPGPGDPAEFDQEAYDYWSAVLSASGLNPAERILTGGKKDNFWMMGDTGPCGPCSEIHIDLTPDGLTGGSLVNADSPYCIELWNLVFIQFNATESGEFLPLRHKHIDTGMGFERVAGIIATTKGFTDFSQPPSNYNSDLFAGIFTALESMSGHRYGATLPTDRQTVSALEMKDVAFRVLADHIRTLCCAIADGILPGNEGRNYVLRRILRRAVLYGHRLHLKDGFFCRLVDPVLDSLGEVFPELVQQQAIIRKVIASEESAFERTIERGLLMLERLFAQNPAIISGSDAFALYDTHGFPLDLTQIIAAEKGLSVDVEGFNREMEQQRERARAARSTQVIRVAEDTDGTQQTAFIGYDAANLTNAAVTVLAIVEAGEQQAVVLDKTPCYAEMGGQLGDHGVLHVGQLSLAIHDTRKDPSGTVLHLVDRIPEPATLIGTEGRLSVDLERREAIQRHHSATHILHWALRKVLGTHVQQAGSHVAPDRLRFDFSHFEALSPEQIQTIEILCQSKILRNDRVSWGEIPFSEKPADVIAFFGDKYGDKVRVVDIGGWSKELCAGTHVAATGEIGLLKIVSESAISAGTRRIEAVCGEAAAALVEDRFAILNSIARRLSTKPELIAVRLDDLQARLQEADSQVRAFKAREEAALAAQLGDKVFQHAGLRLLIVPLQADSPAELRDLSTRVFKENALDLLVTGASPEGKVSLIAMASPAAIAAGHKAGDVIRQLTTTLGGKGGGKPDFAMGGGSQPEKLIAVLQDFQQAILS
jgi:alanyl-tRNA synthetase